MRALIPISALALALGSGAASAGDNEKHGAAAAQFESLDRNSDQRISESEASSDENVSGRFAALDIDSDGYITKREYTARVEKDRKDQQQPRNPMPEDYRKPYGGVK